MFAAAIRVRGATGRAAGARNALIFSFDAGKVMPLDHLGADTKELSRERNLRHSRSWQLFLKVRPVPKDDSAGWLAFIH
jgi:hypothetical protein